MKVVLKKEVGLGYSSKESDNDCDEEECVYESSDQ